MERISADELVKRYKNLYTGAVSDTLDELGQRDQALPHYIIPLKFDTVVAGPAFTGQGYPVGDTTNNDLTTGSECLSRSSRAPSLSGAQRDIFPPHIGARL